MPFGSRLHLFEGDLKGLWSLKVSGYWRLTISKFCAGASWDVGEWSEKASAIPDYSCRAGTKTVRLPLLSIGLTRPDASICSTSRAARL